MKKLFTLMAAGAMATQVSAQVVLTVEQPASLAGTYNVTWVDPTNGWDLSPDLADPLNAISDTLVIVDDGSAADSLGCDPLVNGADVAGQIAVVYRGTCEFGMKALNAQNAGARAVLIVNNQPGAPVAMGAGAVGAQITIPVAMISDLDGAVLNGGINGAEAPVVAFIGSIINLTQNDVGFFKSDVLLPTFTARPSAITVDGSMYNFRTGLWLFSFGSQTQSSVTVTAEITQGTDVISTVTSSPFATGSGGDSVWVDLGVVSLSSYTGTYTLTYTAEITGITDELESNNSFSTSFETGSVIAYAPIDQTTHLPVIAGHVQPGDPQGDFGLCVHFRDPNASQLTASGLYFSMAPAVAGTPIAGEFVQIDVHEWTDEFVGLADAPTAPTLNNIYTGEFTFAEETPSQTMFHPFAEPVTLQDNMRYLFCVTTFSQDFRLGYSSTLDYSLTQDSIDNVITCVMDGTSFFPGGFIGGGAATITVETGIEGLDENATMQAPAFPNPASTQLNIPMTGVKGAAQLRILDVDGKEVASRQVRTTGSQLIVDVAGIAPGAYTFAITTADGLTRNFKAIVAR